MIEWPVVELGDVSRMLTGYPFPSQRYTDDLAGPRLLRGDNVVQGTLRWDGAKRWPYDDVDDLRAYFLEEGDVIVAMDRPWIDAGLKYAAVRVDDLPALLVQRVARLRGSNVLDKRFLKYIIGSRMFTEHVLAVQTGTAVPHISGAQIRQFRFPLPPLVEQRAIGKILGTIDDKIELNRRMNETLEAMARALFKSWFLDFDPVRAKAQGLDPKLPRQIADHFPARLVASNVGDVPDGWRVRALGDYVEATRGLSYKGSGLGDFGEPLHNLNSIYEGGGYKYEGIKRYSGSYAPHNVLRAGDVIVANTEQGHDRLLIGYAAIVPERFGDKGLFSHHIYRLRPKPDSVLKPAFLCSLLNSRRMHDVVSRYANGTTVNMLSLDGVQRPLFACPPSKLVDAFEVLASNVLRRQERAVAECHTLTAIRDTLLPKLISGEIRVRDADYGGYQSSTRPGIAPRPTVPAGAGR